MKKYLIIIFVLIGLVASAQYGPKNIINASKLDGHPASYFAPIASPTFITSLSGFTAGFSSTPIAESGLIGLTIAKPSDTALAHGITWKVDNTYKWDIGLDYQNDDFILAYNHHFHDTTYAKSGDIFRVSKDNNFIINPDGAGSPFGFFETMTIDAGGASGTRSALHLWTRGNGYNILMSQRLATTYRAKIGWPNGFQIGSDYGQNKSNDLWFYKSGLVMLLDGQNNRVGVANDTPLEPLDVTGNIKSSGTIYAPKIRTSVTDTTGVGSTANIGTMMYYNGHFYGLKAGTPPTWTQLDN